MMKWFNDLISADSTKSSARFLNVMGGFVVGSVYIADFVINRVFNIEGSIIVCSYYGGVYGLSGAISYYKGKLKVGKDAESAE